MSRVQLKHVHKTFPNGVTALGDVNLDVPAGELLVLVGPSGCGKTTTLRLIAGLEPVSGGEIFIDDRLVNDVRPADRDVAMVFQNAALYPHLSVYDNMAFGLKMLRTTRDEIERRVTAAAAVLSITSLLARRPAELSGGERRRVAIGRAMVRAPRAYLYDEPLSDLDPILRSQLRAELARFRTPNQSTIYVTHDQAEAMMLGDRIAVMDRGEIQQIDSPRNVYERPANVFAASFFGSPGMNLIPGAIRGGVFRCQATGEHVEPAAALEVPGTASDGEVILGVRPNDLIPSDSQPLATVIVDVVEYLGHELLAHFRLAGGRYVSRVPAHMPVRPGEPLRLSVRSGALHFFSAADGRRID